MNKFNNRLSFKVAPPARAIAAPKRNPVLALFLRNILELSTITFVIYIVCRGF